MRILAITIASGVFAGLIVPASATTVFETDFVCPVGGEEFRDYAVGSTSSWGQRPDGRPVGGVAPWPVVECPGNGLPIFQEEFTEPEKALLAQLLETPEYKAMRSSDSTYRRIWWLRKQMGAGPYSLAGNLLAASWEVDEVPDLKQQYQINFAEAADALVWSEGDAENWFWLRIRGANALRETGQFAEARRVLTEIDRPAFVPQDEEGRDNARFLLDGLAALVDEENTSSEPTNLMGPRNAVYRCVEGPSDMTRSELEACASAPYREEIAAFEAYSDDVSANVEAAGDAVEEAAADLDTGDDESSLDDMVCRDLPDGGAECAMSVSIAADDPDQ